MKPCHNAQGVFSVIAASNTKRKSKYLTNEVEFGSGSEFLISFCKFVLNVFELKHEVVGMGNLTTHVASLRRCNCFYTFNQNAYGKVNFNNKQK